jgi:hypothetical protein
VSEPEPPAWTIYAREPERVVAGSGSGADLEGWRHTEPTPWVLGLIVSAFGVAFGAMLMLGLYALIGSFARWAGLVAVFIVGPAIGWTLWDFRFRPVWRWIVWGSLTGLLAGIGSAVALFALGR